MQPVPGRAPWPHAARTLSNTPTRCAAGPLGWPELPIRRWSRYRVAGSAPAEGAGRSGVFFVFWGSKVVTKKLGYVADFCPICRGPQPFELRQVNVVRHIYYVSVGTGRLAGHQRTCSECGTTLDAQTANYASVSPVPQPVAELIRQTFPRLAEVYEQRLALEERVRTAPATLSPADRKALIRAPFLLLSPRVERRFASTHIDRETGLWILAVFGAIVAAGAIAARLAPDEVGIAMLSVLLGGIVVVGTQVARSNVRFLKRDIYPVLARTLRPLRPNESEIAAVLGELKGLGHRLGGKAKLAELMAAFD